MVIIKYNKKDNLHVNFKLGVEWDYMGSDKVFLK